ncbi:MAG: lipoyl synthase [Actinomycetota bacterium]|nr:lipoyl synthase [Actinomycetota bacterium]
MTPFRVRWLGRVDYDEAWDLQQQLFVGSDDHLLLLEHPPLYTMGVRAKAEHLLVPPDELGADLRRVNRGGDVTFHGPGQLVGYPVMNVAGKRGGGMADTVAFIDSVEQVLIDALADFGLAAGRLPGNPGAWLDPGTAEERKVAAIGVRLSRGRSMHGFALNVNVDHRWFDHIVPCGLVGKSVTSLRAEGVDVDLEAVADRVAHHAALHLAPDRPVDRQDVAWRRTPTDLSPFSRGEGAGEAIKPERSTNVRLASKSREGRLASAGVTGGFDLSARKPDWMRVKLETGPELLRLKKLTRSLDLVTVCEEAGCPNIFDCWNEGTATFMLLGDRCTRACGFCLIDTRKPGAVDSGEPDRVAEAVATMDLSFAVLTMVARDDLADGGANVVAASIDAIHRRSPGVGVEVLISDLKGSAESLAVVCDARPEVLNHNIETVPRLQRAVRPSAGYARSLGVLARAKAAGLTTKSGMILGMGETFDEVVGALADLSAVGVDIVTVGQYLRPTTNHLAVQRWWTPDEFAELKRIGEGDLGIAHVESSPLTRSSHHAGTAAAAAVGFEVIR